MNDELIKRETLVRQINEWTDEILPDDLLELLQDCRAALSSQSNSVVKESLITGSRKYVPMTDDDFMQVDISTGMYDPKEAWAYERNIEAEVIRRAGLEVAND